MRPSTPTDLVSLFAGVCDLGADSERLSEPLVEQDLFHFLSATVVTRHRGDRVTVGQKRQE